MAMKEWNRR